MSYDYSKLSGRIKEVYGTQGNFAKDLTLSENAVSEKLNGFAPWKDKQISKAVELLGIERSDIPKYFFTPKVGGAPTNQNTA